MNDTEEAKGEKAAESDEEMFMNNCASCHGMDLTGGVSPRLNRSWFQFIQSGNDRYNGKWQGCHTPLGYLEEGEAKAIAEWLTDR